MSDCEHCWHLSHSLTMNPPIHVSVCCHCGTEKREQQRIGRQHGPHHPRKASVSTTGLKLEGKVPIQGNQIQCDHCYCNRYGGTTAEKPHKVCCKCGDRKLASGVGWTQTI